MKNRDRDILVCNVITVPLKKVLLGDIRKWQIKHERALIHCPVCDYMAESQKLLQRHTKSIHKGFTLCNLWINILDGSRYHPYIDDDGG